MALTWAFASSKVMSSGYMPDQRKLPIMVAGHGRRFLCRKTLPSSEFSQVRREISTHSDGNFGLAAHAPAAPTGLRLPHHRTVVRPSGSRLGPGRVQDGQQNAGVGHAGTGPAASTTRRAGLYGDGLAVDTERPPSQNDPICMLQWMNAEDSSVAYIRRVSCVLGISGESGKYDSGCTAGRLVMADCAVLGLRGPGFRIGHRLDAGPAPAAPAGAAQAPPCPRGPGGQWSSPRAVTCGL